MDSRPAVPRRVRLLSLEATERCPVCRQRLPGMAEAEKHFPWGRETDLRVLSSLVIHCVVIVYGYLQNILQNAINSQMRVSNQ